MPEWLQKYKAYAIAGGIFLLLIFYFFFSGGEDLSSPNDEIDQIENTLLTSEAEEEEAESPLFVVDVKGAVKNPGVYEAAEGERIKDIVDKAGGLTEQADERQVNFAMRVADEMVIYVPEQGEEGAGTAGIQSGGANDGKVNLNTAGDSELQTLTGIGPAKAAVIIEYRESNGPFETIEDLKKIGGIGEKTFEKLKDHITVK